MDKELNKAIKNLKKFAYTTTGTFSMKEAKIILNYIQNSIPKKKVENKIEELDKEIIKVEQMNASATKYDTIQKLDNQLNILQELLEDK